MLIGGDSIAEYKIRKYERAIAKVEKEHGLEPGTLQRELAKGQAGASIGGNTPGDVVSEQERLKGDANGKWTETLAPPNLATSYRLPGN